MPFFSFNSAVRDGDYEYLSSTEFLYAACLEDARAWADRHIQGLQREEDFHGGYRIYDNYYLRELASLLVRDISGGECTGATSYDMVPHNTAIHLLAEQREALGVQLAADDLWRLIAEGRGEGALQEIVRLQADLRQRLDALDALQDMAAEKMAGGGAAPSSERH